MKQVQKRHLWPVWPNNKRLRDKEGHKVDRSGAFRPGERRGGSMAEWSSCVDVEDVGAEVGRSSQLCLCASKKAALGTFLGQAQEWRLKHFTVWKKGGGSSLLSQTITSHISHMVSLQTVLMHAKVLGHTTLTVDDTTKSVPCCSTIILSYYLFIYLLYNKYSHKVILQDKSTMSQASCSMTIKQ